MRAAVQFEMPGQLEIVDVDVANPIGSEVLIDVAASGLCHSDLHFLEGKYSTDLPVVLGHEAAGVVASVGPHVTYVKPGDHVITCLSTFCGSCPMCMRGRPVLCERIGVNREPEEPPRTLVAPRFIHALRSHRPVRPAVPRPIVSHAI